MNLRSLSIGLSSGVLLGQIVVSMYLLATCEDIAVLETDRKIVVFVQCLVLVIEFTLFTPILLMVFSMCSKCSLSQILLSAGSILYGVYFAFGSVCFMPDELAFLFWVGITFLPVSIPLWITVLITERRYRKKNQPSPPQSGT